MGRVSSCGSNPAGGVAPAIMSMSLFSAVPTSSRSGPSAFAPRASATSALTASEIETVRSPRNVRPAYEDGGALGSSADATNTMRQGGPGQAL